MLRDIGAVVAGLAVAVVIIMAVQMVGHGIWPPPEGLDWNDTEVIRTYASQLPFLALLFPIVSYFLGALAGVTDPERKRKVIGNLFIDVFEEEAQKHGDARWLAQGTIYPDVIESAGAKTGKAHVIKSHHNVGGLPEHMKLELVEPLRFLFKDEVRAVGHELGLPDEIVWRHPFPGPGLAVRIVGAVTKDNDGFISTSRIMHPAQ